MALQGSSVANFKAKHKLDVSSQSRKHSRKETPGTAKVVRRNQKNSYIKNAIRAAPLRRNNYLSTAILSFVDLTAFPRTFQFFTYLKST